jgi:hypothetical protein
LFRTFVAALMLATGVIGNRAYGQAGDAKEGGPASRETNEAPPAVTAAKGSAADGPDIFLLPDENGKLRRLLGYRYEDFFKAWQAEEAARDEARQPRFVIESLAIDGVARDAVVDVTINIDVQLESDGWIEVPIQLPALILDSSEFEAKERPDFITFDAQRGGYAVWLKGKPKDRRKLVLKGKFSSDHQGDARRLEMELPAAQSSIVKLDAPGAVTVEAPRSAIVDNTSVDGLRRRCRIEGVKGRLAISWGEGTGDGRATELEAVTDSIVNVEQGRLAYGVYISVRSVGSPIERMRIKLPDGAKAAALSAEPGYSVAPIAGSPPPGAESVVEVTFDEPSQTPPQVRLEAEQTTADERGTVLRLGAFEVLGAFRQRGSVAVRVSDRLHAHFSPEGSVRQIDPDDLPPAMLGETPLAGFETADADWSVEVYTQPRQRKVSVTPEFDLHLGSQGATLDVALDYQISGGRLFELRIDLRGWELTEQPIESGGAVDLGEYHVTPEEILILPLKKSDMQQVRLRFSLRREAGLGVHDLPLPEVQDAFALPGDLKVACDPAWRISAQIDKSVGVSPVEPSPDAASADVQLGEAEMASPSLRLQTFLPQARIAIDVSQRDQQIAANSTIDARLNGRALEVEQRVDYEILYQPANELTLTVSADLLGNEGLALLLDGKPLPSTAVDIQPLSSSTSDDAERNLRLIVTLPEPIVGGTRLTIPSRVTLNDAQRTGMAAIVLPLAVPSQSTASRATIASADGNIRPVLSSAAAAGLWSPLGEAEIADDGPTDPNALRVESSKPVRELALRLDAVQARPPVATRLEAAWAQTWVAAGMRQDRLAYRFHTSGSRIVVVVPGTFEEVEVLLDRRVVAADRTQPGSIVVPIPAGDRDRSHTLELRRHTPLSLGSWGKQAVAFPSIEGAAAWSPFFWQLILPPDLAALATPAGMSAEYRLGWQGMRWGREPTQSQRDLERWTGATAAPTPGPRTNQYLYSAFQPPENVEFVAVRRIWLAIAAAVVALGVGLAWLYTSLARSASFWLVLCIAAVAMLFVYPEAAVLMVQAIVLGGAFTLFSVVIQWLLGGARPRRSAPPTPASSIASLGATQSWIIESPGAADVSAPSGSSYQASGSAP